MRSIVSFSRARARSLATIIPTRPNGFVRDRNIPAGPPTDARPNTHTHTGCRFILYGSLRAYVNTSITVKHGRLPVETSTNVRAISL